MSLLEWLGVITGAGCVWLTVREHIANFPIGIANNILFVALFVPKKLYADTGLQLVYIALGLYGWWHWWRGGPRRTALPVSRTPLREAALVAAAALLAFGALGAILDHHTDSDVPYWDALPTTLSLAAQYLLTRKYLANWAVWIFGANLPFLVLYLYKDLKLIAGLQVVFIALSVAGWTQWRRSLLAQGKAEEPAREMEWSVG